MIDSIELRLNNVVNYIYYNPHPITPNYLLGIGIVTSIGRDKVHLKIKGGTIIKVHYDCIEPIEFTDSQLEKFIDFSDGTFTHTNFKMNIYFNDCWHINYEDNEKYGKTKANICGFFNLHELQNLYFSLTKKELSIIGFNVIKIK
jgi:hypothetical protein